MLELQAGQLTVHKAEAADGGGGPRGEEGEGEGRVEVSALQAGPALAQRLQLGQQEAAGGGGDQGRDQGGRQQQQGGAGRHLALGYHGADILSPSNNILGSSNRRDGGRASNYLQSTELN